jgi:hypothetical protein
VVDSEEKETAYAILVPTIFIEKNERKTGTGKDFIDTASRNHIIFSRREDASPLCFFFPPIAIYSAMFEFGVSSH